MSGALEPIPRKIALLSIKSGSSTNLSSIDASRYERVTIQPLHGNPEVTVASVRTYTGTVRQVVR